MATVKKKSRAKAKKDRFYELCVKGEFEKVISAIEIARREKETKKFNWPYGNQPLHFAAAYGNLEVVRRLTEDYESNPQCVNGDKVTPLHFACLGGHITVVEYLITKCGCNPNALDKNKSSPLHYVCYGAYKLMFVLSLEEKQRSVTYYKLGLYNTREQVNESVHLVESTEWISGMTLSGDDMNYLKVAKSLLFTFVANPLAQNAFKQTPMFSMLPGLACWCGSVEDVHYFIDTFHLDANEILLSLLCISYEHERLNVLQFLVQRYVTKDTNLSQDDVGQNVFKLACSCSNLPIIKHFTELSIFCPTINLLKYATEHGASDNVLKYLASNLSEEKQTSYYVYDSYETYIYPVYKSHEHLSYYHGIKVLRMDTSLWALLYGLEINKCELMKTVVECTDDITDPDGNTPLHLACIYCNLQFVSFLLSMEQTDTRNVANKNGMLPLHFACIKNNIDLIRAVSPDYDVVNQQDSDGDTALHVACMNENLVAKFEIVDHLVKQLNVNIWCQNNKHKMPLHIFLEHCNSCDFYGVVLDEDMLDSEKHDEKVNTIIMTIVKLLSSLGPSSNVDTQDNAGQTPLHIACRYTENVEIVRYLTQEKNCSQNIKNDYDELPLHIVAGCCGCRDRDSDYYYRSTLTYDIVAVLTMAKLVSSDSTLNVDSQDNYGDTPLHLACKRKNIDYKLIHYLVEEKKCNQNIQNQQLQLPLHCIQRRYIRDNEPDKEKFVTAVMLVSTQEDLNVNAQDDEGNTPLHLACKNKNFRLIEYLTQVRHCDQGIQDSKYNRLPLHIITGMYCELRVSSNFDSETKKQLFLALKLVSSQPMLSTIHTRDSYGQTPLHIACRSKCLNVVKYLVFEKCCIPTEHPEVYTDLEIHVACTKSNDIDLLRKLVTKENVNCETNSYEKDTPLHVACRNNNLEAVELLTQMECDMNAKNGNQELPLHVACHASNLSVVELVADCDLSHKNHEKQTPLDMAFSSDNVDVVESLIKVKHCSPNVFLKMNDRKDTPLHVACRSGATKVARCLIENGYFSNTTILNENGQLPFHLACTKSLEMVKMTSFELSREQLTSQTSGGFSSIHIASSHGLLDVVEYLVERGCSPFKSDSCGYNALGSACGLRRYSLNKRYQSFSKRSLDYYISDDCRTCDTNAFSEHVHPHVVRYLVEKCELDPVESQGLASKMSSLLSVKVECPSLLEVACIMDNLELLKALTVLNVNCIDCNGNTPLHLACKYGRVSIVNYLIQQDCDQTIKNYQSLLAIHYASEKSVEIVKLLISCNVNEQSSSGDTALHIACKENKEDIVKHLVQERNCSTSIWNGKNQLAVHTVCIFSNNVNILRLLVEVNHRNSTVQRNEVNSAIHIACESGKLQFLKVLITSDTINDVDTNGNTVLHIACKKKDLSIIQWLLQRGADSTIQNADGDTPLHLIIKTFSKFKHIPSTDAMAHCNTLRSILIRNNSGDLPIHVACKEDNQNFVLSLSTLDKFEDSLSLQNHEGNTSLHVAVVAASSEIIRIVSRHHICNTVNKHGNTPLHLACQRKGPNKSLIVKALIKLGCDVNITNKCGQLPVHIACANSGVSIVELLMKRVPAVEMIGKQDSNGNTPLHLACQAGKTETVLTFLQMVGYIKSTKEKCVTKKHHQKPISVEYIIDDLTTSNPLINQGNNNGDTPLHLAIQNKQWKIVKYLVKCKSCNFSRNNYGETPLHLACAKSNYEIVKLVTNCESFNQVENCPPNNSDHELIQPGDTPFHIACRVGNKNIVEHLLHYCDNPEEVLSISNAQEELPIHLSCLSSPQKLYDLDREDLLDLIIKFSKDLANKQTVNQETVLHIACKLPSCSTRMLEILVEHCDVTIPNCNGDLPIHLLCRNAQLKYGIIDSIKLLLTESISKSNCFQNDVGDTPLHEVCRRRIGNYRHIKETILNLKLVRESLKSENSFEVCKQRTGYAFWSDVMEHVIQFLLERGCDESLSNKNGETPLHLACRYQTLPIVKLLQKCDVFKETNEGNSILHYACLNDRSYEAVTILEYLVEKVPELVLLLEKENVNKETPIHNSCSKNNLELTTLLIKLSKGANVSHPDIHGHTPITRTTDSSVISLLLEHGADPTPLYEMHQTFFEHDKFSNGPPPTPVNLLVIGDPGAGKTTLVQSLKNEKGEKISQTEDFGHTAGIIPNNFSSNIYGKVTMYDFAGHSEYYSSHGGLMHNIIKKSPPIIMVLVNLTEDTGKSRERVLYWLKFVLDYCASLEGKPHLIILGSHADVLREEDIDPNQKSNDLLKLIEGDILDKHIVFKNVCSVDCTQSQSTEINELREKLKESCTQLRETAKLRFSSHCLYVFLQQQFHDRLDVTLEYLLSRLISYNRLKRERNCDTPTDLLPTDFTTVYKMCEELSERGHLLFIRHPNRSQVKSSRIVLKKDVLLNEIVGRIFAPVDFPQHLPLANSTGVVAYSKLKMLPYDPSMLIGFLTHMEFCQEIKDSETLHRLGVDRECRDSPSEKYYFFPSLVSIERPSDVWHSDDLDFKYHCGLLLKCTEPGDFFNSQFVQVLLLRLAFTYALVPDTTKNIVSKSNNYETCLNSISEKRVCSVWKSGIYWLDMSGIGTLVDVIDNNKILILTQCIESLETRVEFLKQRSSVLSVILQTKKDLCPCPPISHFLLHPRKIQHPLPPLADVSLFTIKNVDRTIQQNKPLVINDQGKCLELNDLFFFEPYALLCKNLVDKLYDSSNEVKNKVVEEDILSHICHHLIQYFDYFCELIINVFPTHNVKKSGAGTNTSPYSLMEKLLSAFQKWQKYQSCHGTYFELRQLLDRVSIFPALGLTPIGTVCNSVAQESKSEAAFQGYLNISNLKEVRNATWEVRAEWKSLGIELGLAPSTLRSIQKTCHHDTDDCFTMMIETWLEGSEPTWSSLIEALKSKTVNCPNVAESVKEAFGTCRPGK